MHWGQVGMGAATAAILVLGANASSLDHRPAGPALALEAQVSSSSVRDWIASAVTRSCSGVQVPHATGFTAFEACVDRAFDGALDIFGELAAHVKQR